MLFKTIDVDGINIFYREAGEPNLPKVVLLHGFPSSSHQYRNLIPALADKFHVIAPDYPGFGNSDIPSPNPSPTRSTRSPKSSELSWRRPASRASAYTSRTMGGRSDSASSTVTPNGSSG